jgi:ketosteroid isomerase-like protein
VNDSRLADFFDAWNAHDVDRIVEFFTPDGSYYASIGPSDNGTEFSGIDEVRRGVSAFLGTYPDASYTDQVVVISGDRGYAQWTFAGTSKSGDHIRYRGVDVFEFDGDMIRVKDAFRKERARPIGG